MKSLYRKACRALAIACIAAALPACGDNGSSLEWISDSPSESEDYEFSEEYYFYDPEPMRLLPKCIHSTDLLDLQKPHTFDTAILATLDCDATWYDRQISILGDTLNSATFGDLFTVFSIESYNNSVSAVFAVDISKGEQNGVASPTYADLLHENRELGLALYPSYSDQILETLSQFPEGEELSLSLYNESIMRPLDYAIRNGLSAAFYNVHAEAMPSWDDLTLSQIEVDSPCPTASINGRMSIAVSTRDRAYDTMSGPNLSCYLTGTLVLIPRIEKEIGSGDDAGVADATVEDDANGTTDDAGTESPDDCDVNSTYDDNDAGQGDAVDGDDEKGGCDE